MPAPASKASELYKKLIQDGYTAENIGSEEEFTKKATTKEGASKLHSVLLSEGYTTDNLGDVNEFTTKLISASPDKKKVSTTEQSALSEGLQDGGLESTTSTTETVPVQKKGKPAQIIVGESYSVEPFETVTPPDNLLSLAFERKRLFKEAEEQGTASVSGGTGGAAVSISPNQQKLDEAKSITKRLADDFKIDDKGILSLEKEIADLPSEEVRSQWQMVGEDGKTLVKNTMFTNENLSKLRQTDYDEYINALNTAKVFGTLRALDKKAAFNYGHNNVDTKELLNKPGDGMVDTDLRNINISRNNDKVSDDIIKNSEISYDKKEKLLKYNNEARTGAINKLIPNVETAKKYLSDRLAGKEFDVTPSGDNLYSGKKQHNRTEDIDNYSTESIEKLLDPNDPYDARALQVYKYTRSFNDAIKNSSNIEEAAINYVSGIDPTVAKQRDMLMADGRDLPQIQVAEYVKAFLDDDRAKELARTNPDFKEIYYQAKNGFSVKYPEYAAKVIAEKISQEREDRGMNNVFINIPTKSSTREIVDDLVAKGEFSEYDKYLYLRDIDPKISVGQSLLRGTVGIPFGAFTGKSPLSTPGGLENALLGFQETTKGMARSIEDIPLTPIATSDTYRLQQSLVDNYSTLKINLTKAHEISEGTGHLIGFTIPMIYGGTALKAAGASEKAAHLINTALMFEGQNRDRALQLFPGDPAKRLTFTAISTAVDTLLTELIPTKSIRNGISNLIKKDVADITNKLATNQITKEAAGDLLIEKTMQALPKFALENAKTAGTITGFGVFHKTIESLMGASDLSAADIAYDAVKEFKQNYLLTPILTLAAIKGKDNSSKLDAKLLMQMASAPEGYKQEIINYAQKNNEPAQVTEEKLRNLDNATKVFNDLSKTNLTEPQKEKYFILSVAEKALMDKSMSIDDINIKEKYLKESEKYNKQKERILNNKDKASEYDRYEDDIQVDVEPKEEVPVPSKVIPEIKATADSLKDTISKGGEDAAQAQSQLDLLQKDPVEFFEKEKANYLNSVKSLETETSKSAIDSTIKYYDELITKIKAYDTKNIEGLPGEVGVGEKPVEAKPVEVGGAQETGGGGVLQENVPSGEGKVAEVTQGEVNALKDVSTTAKALQEFKDTEIGDIAKPISESARDEYYNLSKEASNITGKNVIGANEISEAYHKAKAENTNPEFVKSVEDLLSKKAENVPTAREEVSGAVQPTPEIPKGQKVEGRVQPSAEPISERGTEAKTPVLENPFEKIPKTQVARDKYFEKTFGENADKAREIYSQGGTPKEMLAKMGETKEAVSKAPKTVTKPAKGKAAKFVAEHIEEKTTEAAKENEPVGAPPVQEHTVETIDNADTTGFNDVQKKNVNDAKKILRAVSKLVGKTTGKKLKLFIHATRESAAKAVYESTIKAGGTEADAKANMQNQGNRGWWSSADGEIHLNMPEIASETIQHEAAHTILDAISKNNPEIIDQFHKQLEGLSEGKELTDTAKSDYGKYDENGKLLNESEVKIEAITDYIAKVADGQIKIDASNFQKIKDYIVNLLTKIGLTPEMDIRNIEDLRKLAQTVSEKFAKGEEIKIDTPESFIKKAETSITSEGIDNDISINDIKGQSDRGIQLSKQKEKVDDETIKAVKTSIINYKDVPKAKISRTLFYDNTRVGNLEIKNRNTGYTPKVKGKGGFFYSYMPESLKNKAVLAFTSINQAIQTLKRQMLYPDSIQAIAAQNFQTAHLGNKSTLKALFGEKGSKDLGIFQEAVENNPEGEMELLNALKTSTINIANQKVQSGVNKGQPTASALEIKKILDRNGGNLDNIKSLNDFRDKVLTFEGGDSFGARNILFTEIFQEKPTKITKSTRESHQIIHYKYGIPTLSEIAEGNNQKQLNNAETGDVIKFVQPYSEPVVYTTDKDIYKQYSENPTPEMVENGIKIELMPSEASHESYPFVLKGENVGVLDNYVAATQLYEKNEKIAGTPKKQSFYKVGRMPAEALPGEYPSEPVPQGKLQFSKKKEEVKGTLDGKPVTFVRQPENVEVVNGFYSPIEKRLTETKIEKQSANKWKKVVGKKDEAKYTGVLGWLESLPPTQQVSKSEIQNWMKDNRIEINEVIVPKEKTAKERYETSNQPLELPGEKTNYKEVLVTLPFKKSTKLPEGYTTEFIGGKYRVFDEEQSLIGEGKTEQEAIADALNEPETAEKPVFKSSHYDEPNILAHIRMNTRVDAEGNKVLHIEEFQSDWGQKGKREGFMTSEKENKLKQLQKEANDASKKFNDIEEELDKQYNEKKKEGESRSDLRKRDSEFNKLAQEYFPAEQKANEARRAFDLFQVENRQDIPEAPFITKTSDWTKLAWKVALKEAVKEGADKITWTTGEQQNDRYDLRKQVDEILWEKDADGTYAVSANKSGNTIFQKSKLTPQKLAEAIGKDAADKIVNNTEDNGFLEGDDLAVGGTGMKVFYGSTAEGKLGIVGDVAKSLFKQEPRTTEINGQQQHSIDITPEMKAQVESGMPMFSKTRDKKISDMKDILKEYVDEGKSLDEIKDIMKDEFGDYYKDVEGVIEQAHAEMTTTSIKNAVTERERGERGLAAVEVEAKRSFGDVFDKANEMIANKEINGLTLAAEVVKNPRPLKAEESAVLLIDRMRISKEYNKKNAELLEAQEKGETEKAEIIQSQMEALEQEMDLNDEAARKSGYEQGLGLAARRMLIAQDYSLVTQMNRLKAANGGKEVPEKYQKQLKDLISKLEAANEKLEKVEKNEAATEKQRKLARVKSVSRTTEQIAKEKEDIKNKIVSKWGQTLARMKAVVSGIKKSVSPTPISPEKQAQLESIVEDVNKMVKLYAESGETNLKNIINNIHADLVGSIPDLELNDVKDVIIGVYDKAKLKSPLTPQKIQAQANVRKVKTQIDMLKEDLKNKQRSVLEKGVDYLHGWHRYAILSGIPSLGKIQMAAFSRGVVTRVENIVGQALSLIPGIRRIAKKAPRHGGISPKAEAKAFTTWFDKMTREDFIRTMKTGISELDYLYGKKEPMAGKVPAWLEFFGRLHSAMKLLPKRAEFFRSLEMRTEQAIKEGKDPEDAVVQQELGVAAYNDAIRAIFMQENIVTEAYANIINRLNENNPVLASALKFALPIVKVPTNYVSEAFEYTPLSGIRALTTLIRARKGMTPEQADYFMRAMKKGLLGTAIIFAGYFNPQAIGGYYTGKRKEDELEAGDIELFGTKLPHWMLHTPLLEMLQLGATMRRADDAAIAKGEKPTSIEGIPQAFYGLSKQVPFFGTGQRISKALEKEEKGKEYLYSLGQSLIEPQLMQNLADWTDMEEGEVVKRKTETFKEKLIEGVPILRKTLEKDLPETKSAFSETEMKDEKNVKAFDLLKKYKVPVPTFEDRKRYRIKVDDKHPQAGKTKDGKPYALYSEDEFKMYNDFKKDYIIKALKILNRLDSSGEVKLTKEIIEEKLKSVETQASKVAKNKMIAKKIIPGVDEEESDTDIIIGEEFAELYNEENPEQ